MSACFDSMDECLLIQRFFAGSTEAWEALYRRHQKKLLFCVKPLLEKHGLESHLAEDVAHETWLALIPDDFSRLARYDPKRGNFLTFLKKVARQIIRKRYVKKRRRANGEVPLADREPLDVAADDPLMIAELTEFKENLTPQESRCLNEKLMNEPPPAPATEPPISPGNERVLKHRLRRKLEDHIDFPEKP